MADSMNIADWRRRTDELDQKLVALLNERAAAPHGIGCLKRQTDMPIYEPDREKEIFQNIRRANHGPLPDREFIQLYERIIDVMREIQRVQINGGGQTAAPIEKYYPEDMTRIPGYRRLLTGADMVRQKGAQWRLEERVVSEHPSSKIGTQQRIVFGREEQ